MFQGQTMMIWRGN